MTNRKTLFLYEELMLLALRDEKGTLAAGNLYEYAIGGALLADLLLRGRVAVTGGSKTIVDVVATERIGDPLLDECLDRLRVAGRRASAQRWVSRFAGLRRLKQRVAQQLCRRGILREDEDRVLLIFTRTIYPEVDPGPERELIARMRAAIFTESREVEPRTAALVSLAHRTDLLKHVFPGRDLKARRARIGRIIEGEVTGKAAKEAMQAMQAAVMVAVMAATSASAASAS